MAILQRDPMTGTYQVKPGDTLNKIASTSGRTLAELQALNPQLFRGPTGFDRIDVGANVNLPVNNSTQPSYSSLQTTPSRNSSNVNMGSNSSNVNTGINGRTSFTESLIKLLKDAQARNQEGQAGLMKQSQGITGLGITDAARNFANERLAPSAGTSYGLNAPGAYEPLQLSIANQQKLATQNLGDISDIISKTQTSYEKEQDRIYDREQKRLDRAASAANRSSNIAFDTDAQIRNFANKFKSIKGPDNYIDPQEWMDARDLWQILGGSDATFETNFKRFLNPLSYKLAGYQDTSGISAKQQALIDTLRKK